MMTTSSDDFFGSFPPADPNPTYYNNAGDDYSFASWTANTDIYLCRVPWSNDYRDIVYFDTDEALDKYLFGQQTPGGASIRFGYSSPIYPGMPVQIDAPFSQVYKYNYLRVSNPAQPGDWPVDGTGHRWDDAPTTFYYFINDVQYSSPNTTIINVQLDVWQTFGRKVQFGRCFVERGHLTMADWLTFDDNGRLYLTVPEGLDCGNEYRIVQNEYKFLNSNNTGGTSYGVVIMSATSLTADYGTEDNPKLQSATGSIASSLPNGSELYYCETGDDWKVVSEYLSAYPWISEGIQSVTAVPTSFITDDPRYYQYTNTGLNGSAQACKGKIRFLGCVGGGMLQRKYTMCQNFRNFLPEKYRYLKKFYTFPYTVVEVTTSSGTPLLLKPECMSGDNVDMVGVGHMVPPSPRVMFYPPRYNADDASKNVDTINIDGGEFTDMMTGFTNLPQFSVTNNSYINYMASNAHSIAYQYSSADWSQQRALGAGQTAYNQASVGMQTAATLTGNQQLANNQTMGVQNFTDVGRGVTSGVTGVLGGALSGGLLGLAGGLVNAAGTAANTALTVNQTTQNTAIQNSLLANNLAANQYQMGYNRDTNFAFAQYAANGDYQNAVAGINAKCQDAKLLQPTTSGQVGGEAFNLATTGWMIGAKIKTVNSNIMQIIGDYWLRYGYAINRFAAIPPGFRVMTKFTYWKLKETYLSSAVCPESFKSTIRGIFEKGVTVWANPDDIGHTRIDDNDIIPGYYMG